MPVEDIGRRLSSYPKPPGGAPLTELVRRLTVLGPRIEVEPGPALRRFVGERLWWEYPGLNLDGLARSVALLPYVWSVAPVVWATDQQLSIDALDPVVSASLEHVRAELRLAYPSLRWDGSLTAKGAAPATPPEVGSRAEVALFTGGVDSTYTALRHAGPGLLLVAAWGPDIPLDEPDRWSGHAARLADFAKAHAGGLQVVPTNVRQSFEYRRLNGLVPDISRWWVDVQFGTTLTALASPVAMTGHAGVIHLASGAKWAADELLRNGSSPRLDNQIDFGFARVHHDGNDVSRQEKLNWIVASGHETPLRVCIGRPDDADLNCGRCIKCLRTIVGVVAAGGDPRAYGFPRHVPADLKDVPRLFAERRFHFGWAEALMWDDIRVNRPALVEVDPDLDAWLTSFDFEAYGRSDRHAATRSRAAGRRLRAAVPWLGPLVAPLRGARGLRRWLP